VSPASAVIEPADGLPVVYFDQHRTKLDLSVSLRRALAPEGDSVIYQDRTIHVAGWAARFLFRKDQLDVPVSQLSGGERARVVIARLMLQPADLLLLDEPTNDIDIPTLEVLEESLMEFPGSLVLVTHDRYMMDRVSTMVLGLDGEGGWGQFADYSQWEQAKAESEERARQAAKAARNAPATDASGAPAKKKLSYKDQREFEGMEQRIHDAEAALAGHHAAMENPAVNTDPARLQQTLEAMAAAQTEVERLYERWAGLEAKLN